MIFPKVKSYVEQSGVFKIDTRLTVSCRDASLIQGFEFLKKLLSTVYKIECTLVESDADITFASSDCASEEYSIDISEKGIAVSSSSANGAIYAASTLFQMLVLDGGFFIPCAKIKDSPYLPMRGIHFYMPARDEIDDFKRLIDFMALMKMNTVILEVGGGMEYERHPEINEAWVKFCKNVSDFPGVNGYKSFQGSDLYWKDSLHTELCGGGYLTKSEVRDLVAYCRARGMDVIPEIQALSHSYYLCIAHPEIAEAQDDPFPDTFCPSNEKSYELYFDVADEVLEVFEPKTVSIGHDEIRVLGWCDKCKDKTGAELVGNEILRLHEFYSKRGVRISMWGETAQVFRNYKGSMVGLANKEHTDMYGRYYKRPRTSDCIDMLPRDILMLDWYHSLGHESEECFDERGFEIIYGNFHGSQFGEWDKRSARKCVRGAEVSSWCPSTEKIFAEDGITFEAMFSSYLLWESEYSNESYDEVCSAVRCAMPVARAVCKGEALNLRRMVKPIYLCESETEHKINLSTASFPDEYTKANLSPFGDELYGFEIHTGNIIIKNEFFADSLLFLHNSGKEMPFCPSHYFFDEKARGIVSYVVSYEDGSVELANGYYGREIGSFDFSFERLRNPEESAGVEIDDDVEGKSDKMLPCYYSFKSEWVGSLAYNAAPIIGEDNSLFCFEWKNPHPGKKIVKIRPYNITHFSDRKNGTLVYLFGIGAISDSK